MHWQRVHAEALSLACLDGDSLTGVLDYLPVHGRVQLRASSELHGNILKVFVDRSGVALYCTAVMKQKTWYRRLLGCESYKNLYFQSKFWFFFVSTQKSHLQRCWEVSQIAWLCSEKQTRSGKSFFVLFAISSTSLPISTDSTSVTVQGDNTFISSILII